MADMTEIDIERLILLFGDCRKAIDSLQDNPVLVEKLLRMLHSYSLTDWIKVATERVRIYEDD